MNAESVRQPANPLQGYTISILKTQGCRCAPTLAEISERLRRNPNCITGKQAEFLYNERSGSSLREMGGLVHADDTK